MIKELMHDPIFLAGKSETATKEDLQVAQDLLDTLMAHKESCVGMAANMIGVRKRIIAFLDESGRAPTSDRVRYCGTPLKYSFSEAKDNKSITVVELEEKGKLSVKTVSLVPMRDMVEIKGRYNEIMLKSFYENTSYQEDYIHITLTDEEDIVDAIGKLRTVYHNLMKLDYDNKRTRSVSQVDGAVDVETKTPIELFSDFYELQNNQPMSDEQKAFVEDLIEQVWEDEK